jgi:LPXTG-motif cell wall-anchored protein
VHLIRGFSLKRPSLTLEKSVNHDTTKGGTGSDVFTVGDTVPYNFKVTNNGNVDLHAVAVTDPKITKISCPATTLAAGASMTCTGSYGPLAKAEVAIGHFDNTATASGKTPSPDNSDVLSNPATAKVPTYTNGALSVKKMLAGLGASAVDSNKTYTISYSYPAGNYQYCSTDNTPTKTTTPYVPKQYAAKANGTITVKADGNAVSSGPIPTGAVVTLGEQQPADTGSVTWETPKFNPASTVTIGCSDNGTSVTVTNTADQVPGSAIWTKVDDAKTPNRLAGSSWTLTGPGVPANTVVTDCTATDKCGKGAYDDQDPAPGAFRLNGLAWNSGSDSNTKQYTLVEKTAPAGYQRDTTPHTFVISKDTVATGQPVNVGQFVNKQAIPPTLPLTGGMSTDAFLIGGSALIVLSAGVAIALRRRSLARMQS